MHVAAKETLVFGPTRFQYFGTDSVDPNTARHINRSPLDKAIKRTVSGSGAGTTSNRIAVQHTAGHGEGPTVVYVLNPLQDQIDLWQDLVINALQELFTAHFVDRSKMDMADGAHHGINFANLLIQSANAVDVLDVHLHVATGSANTDDFMAARQGVYCSLANGSGGTNDNYLHRNILSCALKRNSDCLWLLVIGSILYAPSAFGQTLPYSRVKAEIVAARLENCPSRLSERRERLKQLFVEAGCEKPHLEEQKVRKERFNVICTLEGESGSTIIIGAHHDKAGNGGGVVDNWSGASLLPSLYEALKHDQRKHTFVFVGFTAEEKGLIGSKHFVKSLSEERKGAIKAMINLDSVGLSHTKLWWNKPGQEMANTIARIGGHLGLQVSGVDPSRVGRGDNESFNKLGIPALMVHSVTSENLMILHSRDDNLKAIRMNDYYDTYKLLAAYLTYMDSNPD